MAHQMIKPYSFLLYLLAFVCFFFIGVSYAGVIEAAKGQMLAGGAIVVGYGVAGAFIGFLLSLIVANKMDRKIIIKLNIALAIFIVGFWAYYQIKYQQRQNAKDQEKQQLEQTKKQTTTPMLMVKPAVFHSSEKRRTGYSIGLGMFAPNFSERTPLYFYGNPFLKKSIQNHSPYDSLTFVKTQHGHYDIATAPPWFMPRHLKLDYEVLLFEVQSVTQEFIEITVNTVSNQTTYVSRDAGTITYWPEFLLNVNSVEFPNPEKEIIYVKPLNSASSINTSYSFMKPLRIKRGWMYVELQDDNFEPKGKGWIKWIQDGKLLIKYSLFG